MKKVKEVVVVDEDLKRIEDISNFDVGLIREFCVEDLKKEIDSLMKEQNCKECAQ